MALTEEFFKVFKRKEDVFSLRVPRCAAGAATNLDQRVKAGKTTPLAGLVLRLAGGGLANRPQRSRQRIAGPVGSPALTARVLARLTAKTGHLCFDPRCWLCQKRQNRRAGSRKGQERRPAGRTICLFRRP